MTRRAAGDRIDREAQEMEAKLMDLRNAMLKERLKRDSVASKKASGGSIWGSAQVPPLKHGVRSSRTPQAATPRSRPGTASKEAPGGAPPPARVKVDSAAGEAPATSRPSTSGGADSPGQGAGSDAVLGGGNFDEEASHASFLAALQEWRSGGDASASDRPADPPPKKTFHHTIDIQTEQMPLERPASAKGSYFEHLQRQSLSAAPTPKQTSPKAPPPAADGGYDSDDFEDDLLELELKMNNVSASES